MNNPFTGQNVDLGDSLIGYSKAGVDQSFASTLHNTGIQCLACGSTAEYRLVPKHDYLRTTEILDKGFICSDCLIAGNIDPKLYGLREIGG